LAGLTDVGAMAQAADQEGLLTAVTNVPLGLVRVDAARRCLSFPVAVNQRTGLVEYVVVTATGKTHESVLRTDVEPQHVHLGMLLLGTRPANTPFFPADPATRPPGTTVRIDLFWNSPEGEVSRPLEDLVLTTNHWQALDRGPWVYNGSYLSAGVFVAQKEGSIVALQVDPSALINNPRPGRHNDELHFVNAAALPPESAAPGIRIQMEKSVARPNEESGPAPAGLDTPTVHPRP
jgi:hypothetical protein